MGYKLIIVLVWLLIPVALGLYLHSDQRRFQTESAIQAELCRERAKSLHFFAGLIRRSARDLQEVPDAQYLRTWRRSWGERVRDAQRELPPLPAGELEHCPMGAALLDEQEQSLAKAMDSIGQALKDKEYYYRSYDALMQLAAQMDQVEYRAQVFRYMPGAVNIYFMLHEELAKMEGRYETQLREIDRLRAAIQDSTTEADLESQKILNRLSMLETLLKQDAGRTYADNVRERWDRFDLRGHLVHLIASVTGSTAEASQAAPGLQFQHTRGVPR